MKHDTADLPAAKFTVHELRAASGAAVQGICLADGSGLRRRLAGTVPAGPAQLLGAYFDPYVDAAAARRTRRAPVVVELPGLVVQSGGHMRAFAGRAYLPQSLPQGVARRGDPVMGRPICRLLFAPVLAALLCLAGCGGGGGGGGPSPPPPTQNVNPSQSMADRPTFRTSPSSASSFARPAPAAIARPSTTSRSTPDRAG